MNYTENYGLYKPDENDLYDVNKRNDNWDIIDEELSKRPTDTGDVGNMKATFTQVSNLANVVSGEKLSVSFGKIAKAITSLISHLADNNNPHSVTKAQVGLGNVDNTADKDKPVSDATLAELNKVDSRINENKERIVELEEGGSGLTELTYAEYLANKAEYDASGKAFSIPDYPYEHQYGKILKIDRLVDFVGATSTNVTVPSLSSYRLIILALIDTNGKTVGSTTFPAGTWGMLGNAIRVYGESNAQWGEASWGGYTSMTLNRTTANTSKLIVFGITDDTVSVAMDTTV